MADCSLSENAAQAGEVIAFTVRNDVEYPAGFDVLQLPEGVTLRMVYDQADLIGSALGGVSRAILIGAGLVVVVLAVAVEFGALAYQLVRST